MELIVLQKIQNVIYQLEVNVIGIPPEVYIDIIHIHTYTSIYTAYMYIYCIRK